METVRILLNNVKYACKARFSYPKAFITAGLCQMLGYFVQFATTWILLVAFDKLENWNVYEVVVLYAIQLMTYGLAGAFVSNTVSDLPDMAKNGNLDDFVVQPINPLLNIMSQKFNPGYLAHFTVSVAMICLSIAISGRYFDAYQLILLCLFILSGTFITAAIMLISTLPCIVLLGTDGAWGMMFTLKSYVNYPLTIYGSALQMFFTMVIPFAFISYYPMRMIYAKHEGLFTSNSIAFAAPIMAVLLLYITKIVWRYTISRYKSSGN